MPTWSWPSIALMCYMWNGAKIWRLIMFLLVVVLFVLFSLRYGTVLTNCFRVNGLNVFPLLRFRRLGKKRLLGTNTRRRKKSEKNKGFNRQLPCWRSKTKSIWSPHGSKLSLLIIFNSCMILYKFRLIVGEKRLFFSFLLCVSPCPSFSFVLVTNNCRKGFKRIIACQLVSLSSNVRCGPSNPCIAQKLCVLLPCRVRQNTATVICAIWMIIFMPRICKSGLNSWKCAILDRRSAKPLNISLNFLKSTLIVRLLISMISGIWSSKDRFLMILPSNSFSSPLTLNM